MRRLMVVIALAVLATGTGMAHASKINQALQPALQFVEDTFCQPDNVGITAGDTFTLDFSRHWDIGDVPGLKSLDMAAGLSIALESPPVRGLMTLRLANVKGAELCAAVRTAPADNATYVLDIPHAGRIGFDVGLEIRRPI